jgi:DNA-binding PadR family transcriptional regulator
VLELAILGLLEKRPMHGYDLRKRLREEFGLLANLSFGSVYPALARLEAAGAVREISVAGPPRTRPISPSIPLTGSLAGERAAYGASARRVRSSPSEPASGTRPGDDYRGTRARKVYEITPKGYEQFERLLGEQGDRDDDPRSFTLKLVFARHLTPQQRMGLFERRRAHLVAHLARSKRTMTDGTRALDPYERSLVEHSSEATERDISWLDRLIEAERSHPLTTNTPIIRRDQ